MLKKAYSVLRDWTGDPCRPSSYSWIWISCDLNADPPRVTALNLRSFGLDGQLPDFSTMDALTRIDMSNNSIYGNIPDFLGTSFPHLEHLDLSDNDLCGPVPSSIKSSNNYRLQQGNPNIGKSCSPGSNGKDATDTEVKIKIRVRRGGIIKIGVGIGAAIIGCIIVTVFGYCLCSPGKKKKGDQAGAENGANQEERQNRNAGAEESHQDRINGTT
ncbi:probable LRR receptor-like serine/threonine-protein kinase At1g05700 [Punica granatum]|uniref:Probable LRR receptor-like serine/threonine-protein kinase At1g05700 n=1 Tax=Punica granatum TaxID=22663 RepID=A0A6P8CLY9_PUNGR|nr:probable LRR receptor-like serine/threonine-protein kinase At1g05700 [Punica granatum]